MRKTADCSELEVSPAELTSAQAIGFFCVRNRLSALSDRQCYGFSNAPALANSTWSYRLPFLIQIVLSSILCVASLCLPYSPRWLALRGRAAEAEHVLEIMQKPGASTTDVSLAD